MKKTVNFIILLFMLLSISFIRCRTNKLNQEKRTAQTVSVITVSKKNVTRSVKLFGAIYGEQQVTLYPKITGRITKIVKAEGTPVNENDTILFVLNDIPGMDYKPGPVCSPIAGIVGKIYVDIGQMVTPTIPVATIASYANYVKVKAPIADQDLPYVKKGAIAQISVASLANSIFQGKVINVSSVVDQLSGSASIEILIPNYERKLIPGMACSIELILEQKEDVIALPLNALFSDNLTKIIVIDSNNIAHFREITIGLIGDELVEIKSGLTIGEKIITIGKERITEGDKVIPIEVQQ